MKLSCRRGAVDMGSIDCTEYIAKMRPPLGILADLLGREVICCWKAHILCVKFSRGENVENLSKVAASTKFSLLQLEKNMYTLDIVV
jgi:hypothetical protein